MIHKKLLSLLVLLMTAASGAWADIVKVMEITSDLTGTWPSDYVNIKATELPGFVPVSLDEAKAMAGSLPTSGTVYLFYAFDGGKTCYAVFQGGSYQRNGAANQTHSQVIMTVASAAKVYYTYDPDAVAVSTNDAEGETTFTEAEFFMPGSNVTVDYELVRDMSVSVSAAMANRVRIQEVENKFQPVVATQINPEVKDNLNTQSPVTMTVTTDYSLQLQKKDENDVWTDVTDLSVGTFRYMVVGNGLYDGIAYTNEFQLFEGYSVEVPAGEYATFYAEDKVKIDESTTGGQLYTITSVNVTDAKATATELTVAAAQTPLLVYNSGSEKKTFLLIPTDDAATSVTAASQFKGTTTATTIAASTSTQNNYAFNGKQFVWVKNALSVAANKCWLEIGTVPAGTRSISIVFGDGTTGIEAIDNGQLTIDNWYDLNGRRLQGKPTKKGVYIQNGKKVVVK